MATRRRNTYNAEDSNSGGGGALLGLLSRIFAGGASPEYTGGIDSAASEGGAALSSGDNAPQAKPGRFTSKYNTFDKILGNPDLVSKYNAEIALNNVANQQALVQAKAMNQQVINPQMQYLQLEKSLAGMPQTAQEGLVDSAINNPNIPKVNGSSFIPGTTTLDPAVAGAARAEPSLPGYAANRLNVANSNLGTEQAQAKILGARDVISSQDAATRAANLLNESQSNLGLSELGQNRNTLLGTSGILAKNAQSSALGESPFSSLLGGQKYRLGEAAIGEKQATANLYNSGRMPLMEAQTKEAIEKGKPEGQKIAERFQAIENLGKTPSTTAPIMAPKMNQPSGPIPQAQAIEGTHFVTNTDGTTLIKVPIVLPNGETLQPGVYKAKK